MHLRLSQVVNEPMCTVSAALPGRCCRPGGFSSPCASMTPDRGRTEQVVSAVRSSPGEQRCRDPAAPLFWASAAVRFGATENLQRIDEISGVRMGRSPVRPGAYRTAPGHRDLWHRLRQRHSGFERTVNRGLVRGRQSQVWVATPARLADVAAHVSLLP